MAFVKVAGGTIRGDTPFLCRSCRHGLVLQGARDSDVAIRCNAGTDLASFTVPFKVITCSKYENGVIPSRWDYEKIAWLIDVTVKRGKAGFQGGDERTVKIFAPGEKPDG